MNRTLKYLAGSACVAAALTLAQGQFAMAKDAQPGAYTKKAEVAKRHKHRTARAAIAAPSRPVWTGPDPTRGGASDYIRQMQREGRCFIDEGYGRYSACSNE